MQSDSQLRKLSGRPEELSSQLWDERLEVWISSSENGPTNSYTT